ncbi:uncharacterized protein EAE98_006038 [Botrytis deweyae]|uniref:2EXR domain-containing protein n=1 Tax=Botrytis deweyae TaxID=2478750 RepID=A0ABQ7ILI6_9HELO|nr:uncharacterized protein EAE98_006038 [Botrytis deweyae]KAF7927656.1 hypothetical protein EAE98_006038 [Botrytis deweyae]
MASADLPSPEFVADATSAVARLIVGIPSEYVSTESSPISSNTLGKLCSLTLTKFHCFPRLPLELRRKIWDIYFGPQLGRIIEIEWDPTHPVDKHHGYRATKASSQAPIGLRDPICRDTRDEILRKCQLWHFDNRPEGHEPPSRLTYFDPSIDIVYFGYNTCFGTMCLFVDNLVRAGKQLSRVATRGLVDRNYSCLKDRRSVLDVCCSYVTESALTTVQFPENSLRAEGNYNRQLDLGLKVLHGFHTDKFPNVYNGWPGLREIIIYAQYFPPVDENTTLRPPTYAGIQPAKSDMSSFWCIEEIKRGNSQFDNWTKGIQPKFSHACLSKRAEPGRVCDSLTMTEGDVDASVWNTYCEEIVRLSSSHCRIRVTKRNTNIYNRYAYFELYGTEEAIFAVKKACL